ncbi:MAG: substrate-binding domain-containing protein, partial [Angelakisella sp.]
GESTMSQQPVAGSPASAASPMARVATAAIAPNTKKAESKGASAAKMLQAGILLGHADDVQTARFKNTFEKTMDPEIKINCVDAAGSADTQRTMFDKMISSGYNVIVLELMDTDSAEGFIKSAGMAGVPLIIIGAEPEAQLLAQYPNIYYMGFLNENLTKQMADETYRLWKNNPTLMNFEEDDWDLTYSSLSKDGYEASGQMEVFEDAMKKLGVSTKLAVDSVTRHFDYNLDDEVDQTIIKDSEIVFYDSSVEAQKVINYFYDPTEFKKRPKQQLALSVIDDGAAKLVQEGQVVFACGPDATELGALASRLATLLIAGQEPSFQNMELEPMGGRSFYLPNKVIRADITPEPAKETETEPETK